MDYVVFPTAGDLARAAADLVIDEISKSDEFVFGLAGGSTPKLTYEVLADAPVDWSSVTTWMTDERWVSPDDAESNQAMVRASLRTEGRVAFVAPDTELEDPADAAERMTKSMAWLTSRTQARSLTFLGMGDDGHTASLFPGTEALESQTDAYLANWVPQHDAWRLTASFGLLARSDLVVFLVAGQNKAEVVSRIAAGEIYPAARVEAEERVLWMLDETAASLL